jgi:DNA-binding response OmpR family regulator
MSAPAERPLVLVVDDDPDCCAVAALLLEHQGYRTLRASSGQECLDVVRREPVELVLLDVMMPGMDGFEVCSILRGEERTRHLPIVLLTARDDMDTRLEGMYHGVSEFLTKPINKHELFARVRAQLHIRNLTQQLETVERSLESARQGRVTPRPAGRG